MKKTITALALMIFSFGALTATAQNQCPENNGKPCAKETATQCATAKTPCHAQMADCNGNDKNCTTPCNGKDKKDCKGDCKKDKCKKGNKHHGKKEGKCGKKPCNPALEGITLTDAQKASLKEQCNTIKEKYNKEIQKIESSRRNDVEKALKKILTADQWKQYEENKARMQNMARQQGQDWTQKPPRK